jgi:hypothetical protein
MVKSEDKRDFKNRDIVYIVPRFKSNMKRLQTDISMKENADPQRKFDSPRKQNEQGVQRKKKTITYGWEATRSKKYNFSKAGKLG